MRPREYQDKAVKAVLAKAVESVMSLLLVLPTGTGKTVVFSLVADERRQSGRVMVIAHRSELIEQAAEKLSTITNVMPAIEKAERRSDEWNVYGKPPIVVASVQTLKGRRLNKFDPHEFSLLIIDEAHHATADSYLSIINHFRQNPACLVLGVTATPDRGDGENLGQVFRSCAYEYTLTDAINDGYLVPIRQRTVEIAGLDFSKVRTTAGDLNQGDLEAVMMLEEPLHGVVHATLEVITGLKTGTLSALKEQDDRAEKFAALRENRRALRTVVFAATVIHAERLAEIFNRWIPGVADFVDGTMTPELRKRKLRAFAENETQILVNVGIATEGFDAPFLECVTVARATKSRPLFAQIIGRGTRPSECVASLLGHCPDSDARRVMIAESIKPSCLILDFAGNNGRHKLVTMVDLVAAPTVDADVLALAKKMAAKEDVDVQDVLVEAAEVIEKRKRQAEERKRKREEEKERQRQAAAEERKHLVGVADYDIYDHGDNALTERFKGRDWMASKIATLHKAKIPSHILAKKTDEQITELHKEVVRRWKHKLCSFKQAEWLRKNGYNREQLHNMSFVDASKILDSLFNKKRQAS